MAAGSASAAGFVAATSLMSAALRTYPSEMAFKMDWFTLSTDSGVVPAFTCTVGMPSASIVRYPTMPSLA